MLRIYLYAWAYISTSSFDGFLYVCSNNVFHWTAHKYPRDVSQYHLRSLTNMMNISWVPLDGFLAFAVLKFHFTNTVVSVAHTKFWSSRYGLYLLWYTVYCSMNTTNNSSRLGYTMSTICVSSGLTAWEEGILKNLKQYENGRYKKL